MKDTIQTHVLEDNKKKKKKVHFSLVVINKWTDIIHQTIAIKETSQYGNKHDCAQSGWNIVPKSSVSLLQAYSYDFMVLLSSNSATVLPKSNSVQKS